ncbi:MAG: GGDEF domain-containing protein [Desulfotalea sp.]
MAKKVSCKQLKKKIKTAKQSTSKGNFTRSLVAEFDKESLTLFNKMIQQTSTRAYNLSEEVRTTAWTFFILSSLIIIATVGIIFYFHKNISIRLTTLDEAIQKRISGQKIEISVKGNDEITDMAKSFIYYAKEVEIREEQLRKLATIDPLTGINNRRSFLEKGNKELARSIRHQEIISFLMIDIDCFKNINDTYGHHTGDVLLINIVQTLNDIIRNEDIIGRLGGEEFAILLVRSDNKSILTIAERLRASIADSSWLIDGKTIKCTISIGVSHAVPNDIGLTEIMKKADIALYKAKKNGRNMVVTEK